jgi:hypothetical protein
MNYGPPPMRVSPPPKRNNNTVLIVLLAVGLPLLLVACCVGSVVLFPTLGFGILEGKKSNQQVKIMKVYYDWTNADGTIDVNVTSGVGDMEIFFHEPLPIGFCTGRIHDQTDTEFPFTLSNSSCGPLTANSGTLKLHGNELTLTITGVPDVVLHKA